MSSRIWIPTGMTLVVFCALVVLIAVGVGVRRAQATPAAVYVKDPLGQRHRHPSTFDFSVNGDLAGEKLRWSGWGPKGATARGLFVESPRPAGSPGVALRGTLRLSAIVTCPDGRY